MTVKKSLRDHTSTLGARIPKITVHKVKSSRCIFCATALGAISNSLL
jgi:hypothetical protein